MFVVFCTVAWNCCVPPAGKVAAVGEIEIVTWGAGLPVLPGLEDGFEVEPELKLPELLDPPPPQAQRHRRTLAHKNNRVMILSFGEQSCWAHLSY